MNILENYIKEVISVEPYTEDWTKEFNKEFVEVTLKSNCYGNVTEGKHIWSKEDWEKIKEQGYFMA